MLKNQFNLRLELMENSRLEVNLGSNQCVVV